MKRNSRKDIYRYVSQKWKVKEGICPPIINARELVTLDKEKVELFNNFLASIFNGNLSSHTSQVASGWAARQGLGEQSPSHCKRSSGS